MNPLPTFLLVGKHFSRFTFLALRSFFSFFSFIFYVGTRMREEVRVISLEFIVDFSVKVGGYYIDRIYARRDIFSVCSQMGMPSFFLS